MGALQLDPVVSVLIRHIQHIKSADNKNLSGVAIGFTAFCFPQVGLDPCCLMEI